MFPSSEKKLVTVLAGQRQHPPPLWLMRQAGRYLPEYRILRTRADSFLELCYSPALAAEATLQPLRRFDLDAAIIFSDILVLPDALGQKVTFSAGEGPLLGPLDLSSLRLDWGRLDRVCETIAKVKAQLSSEQALIGFCGAPWTVACYMIAGRSTPDQAPARSYAYRNPEALAGLIDILVECSIEFLLRQLRAGADVYQIFDSWAGVLPTAELKKWCIDPVARIVDGVRRRAPGAKSIVFPRGVGSRLSYYANLEIDGLGLDATVDRAAVESVSQFHGALQGNLDPVVLAVGGPPLREACRSMLQQFSGRAYIANLGHGVLPNTPIENVEELISIVRGGSV